MHGMTSRERLEAALQGRPLDHLPFSPNLAYVWESFPEDVQKEGQAAFHRRIGADPLHRGAPCPVKNVLPSTVIEKKVEVGDRCEVTLETPVGSLHYVNQKSRGGNTTFLVEHPLKVEDDFKIQTWIEEHTTLADNQSEVHDHFQCNGKEGLSIGMLVPRYKSAFQSMVEYYAGTVGLTYALMDYPETVAALWQAMVANDLKAVAAAASCADYEYYLTWEDSSTQNYSPDWYRQFIAAEITQWCSILGKSGKRYIQHACGHIKHIIGDIKDQGTFAVESLSPTPTGNIDLAQSRQALGDSVGIIGGIEPIHFLNLDIDELTGYVEQVIADGKGGPFVLANSDSCPPGVTEAKFARCAEVAKCFT
jgi:hypothetical protein